MSQALPHTVITELLASSLPSLPAHMPGQSLHAEKPHPWGRRIERQMEMLLSSLEKQR